MTCRRAKANLGRYLDGELFPREAVLLQEHLRECPACARESAKLAEIGGLLQDLATPPPPAGLARSILDGARLEPAPGARRNWLWVWRAWPPPMRFAAAGTAVAAVCAGLLASDTGAGAAEASELAWLQGRPPLVAAYRGTTR